MRIIIIRPVNDALPGPADPAPSRSPSSSEATVVPARVDSATLLGRSRELVILHAGREYRLRVTQNGKLILTA